MAQDPLTLYKLIVLYMLDRVAFPLTQAQVFEFILDKEYTNFLNLQQAISELTGANLILAKSIRNRTHLELTEDGRQTLSFFSNRISPSIKEDIDKYFKENEFELRNEVSVYSNYYKSTSGEYEASLVIKERSIELLNITLSVPTESIASSICDKWEGSSQEIYNDIVKKLF
ncbi:MAG: DUF4364 family protein [Lachnospiraceae bacterium]|nr:DUF4364 family protein [Lachnospiraceae bacterium]